MTNTAINKPAKKENVITFHNALDPEYKGLIGSSRSRNPLSDVRKLYSANASFFVSYQAIHN